MNPKLVLIGAVMAFSLHALADDKDFDPSKLPPASSKSGLTYDTDIKPIFDKSCAKCHSGEKAKGKLHLDSLAGILKGGKDGAAVVAGKSGQSPLVYAVAHVGD